MSRYTVQVYCNGNVEYREVLASSYEEARDLVATEVTVGRIIAVVKRKEN